MRKKTDSVIGEEVIAFAYGYATRIIEEMEPKENWEDYDTWCAHGDWDINFHVRDGYLFADAYPWSFEDGIRSDKMVRLFAEWIK